MLVAFGYSVPVFAMTISPVRYEIQGDPGQTVTKEMTIINDDTTSVTYYSSYANFEAQGETGSAAFVEPKDDIGTWMNTPESVTLLPGEQKTISFSVAIPKNAEPGGHFGVLFWGTSPNTANGKQVSVSAKTGLLVLLSVNGDVKEGGGLLDFATKDKKFFYNSLPVTFSYRFRNDGGDRVKPVGFIKIRSFGFIPAKKLDANGVNGNILPNSVRKFNVDWIKYTSEIQEDAKPANFVKTFFSTALYQWRNFAVGLFSAKLDLTYGIQKQNATKTVFFFVFSWQLIICLIVIFTIVFFVGRKLIRRYNRYIIKKAHSLMKKEGNVNNV